MALYTIADIHFSSSGEKAMDIFDGWHDYQNKIINNWKEIIKPEDMVVLPGDISWAMGLENGLDDFKLIDSLPGTKYLLKGNHDYWWSTKNKMDNFFRDNCLNTINIIHNNSAVYGEYGICGTRGWMLETYTAEDEKIVLREAQRLETSILDAINKGKKPIVFLHYPVVYGELIAGKILDVLLKYNIEECYYGHLHGKSQGYAYDGEFLGINFKLVAADRLNFTPILVKK